MVSGYQSKIAFWSTGSVQFWKAWTTNLPFELSVLGAILLSSLILFALVFSLCVVGYIHVYDQIFSPSNMPCVIWCISLYSRALLISSSTLPPLNIAPPSCSPIAFPWSCMCLVSCTFFLTLFSTQLSQLLPVSASFYGSVSPCTNGRFHLQLFFRPRGICLFMGSAVLQVWLLLTSRNPGNLPALPVCHLHHTPNSPHLPGANVKDTDSLAPFLGDSLLKGRA